MVSFEDVCKRIFADTRWVPNVLIGGVLSFIPVANIFALGYLYRYFAQVHRGAGFAWPEWRDWEGLFKDGLRLLAVAAVYGLIPVFLLVIFLNGLNWAPEATVTTLNGQSISVSTHGNWLPFVGVGSIVLALYLLVSPLWVMAMLYAFQPRQRWQVLLRPVVAWLMTRAAWPAFVVPVLAFWGLLVLGWPVIGFAFFLGFLVLGAYYTRLFLEIESRGPSR